jgi:hypothetical protein
VLSHIKVLGLIVILGIGLRLYRIAGPFSDWHQYRQFDTAAIARNLSEDSLNVFYPQVDWRGNSPGYVEVEFQAFTFVVAALYRAFGVHEWLARALNLLFYAFTAILLYHLASAVFSRRAALLAAGFYSILPISYSVSHSFQPDTFMVFCTLAGIYYFWLWTEGGSLPALAFSAAATATAAMIKPFCLYAAVPLIYLCWRKFGWRFLARPVLWVYAVVVVVPMAAWYLHAYHLWELYGNTFGIFGGRIKGVYLGADSPEQRLLYNLASRLVWMIATPVGLVLLAAGFRDRPPSRNYVFHWWALGFLATIPLVPAGHAGHFYYQLPLVLIVAPAMGWGLTRLMERRILSERWAAAACLAILACSVWTVRPMIASGAELEQRMAFGKRVEQLTPANALIVFSYPLEYRPTWYSHRTLDGDLIAGDPTDFYNSHRKGWSLFTWQTSPELLRKLQSHHAEYFATFFPKYLYEQSPEMKNFLADNAVPVDVRGRWILYRFRQEAPSPASGLGRVNPGRGGSGSIALSVAQRSQLLDGIAAHAGPALRAIIQGGCVPILRELRLEPVGRTPGEKIVILVLIRREVVQFLVARGHLDVFERSREQGLAASPEPRGRQTDTQRIRKRLADDLTLAPAIRFPETPSLDVLRRGVPKDAEDRGHQIRQAHIVVYRCGSALPGVLDQQRNMNHVLVNRQRVPHQLLLAERLAMIRRDNQ